MPGHGTLSAPLANNIYFNFLFEKNCKLNRKIARMKIVIGHIDLCPDCHLASFALSLPSLSLSQTFESIAHTTATVFQIYRLKSYPLKVLVLVGGVFGRPSRAGTLERTLTLLPCKDITKSLPPRREEGSHQNVLEP